MKQKSVSHSLAIFAAVLLSGCVAIEPPQSSLALSSAAMVDSTLPDLSYESAELPLEGPVPYSRPDILSLNSGASISPNAIGLNQDPLPVEMQAMLEPLKLPESVQTPIATMAQPVVATNTERDCLMRAMYFESHRSSHDGLLSVGTVVMNRLEHGVWGNAICGVVGAKRQFAPGVLSRRMQGNLADLQALADQIIAGKRQAKLGKNVMFFHVAGMKFPYKNMRYVHVAGGNTFYYKAQRKRRA